ncbi:DUF2254 family protein [Chloroflexota bacterium]
MKQHINFSFRVRNYRPDPNIFVWIYAFIAIVTLTALAISGNIFNDDASNARYLLSALAQAQAAIIAIVVTLSLVAIQIVNPTHSKRMMKLVLGYKRFWMMLLSYCASIIFDIVALANVGADGDSTMAILVMISIFLLAFTFGFLLLFIITTMSLITPLTVLKDYRNQILLHPNDVFESFVKYGSPYQHYKQLFDMTEEALRAYDYSLAYEGREIITQILIQIHEFPPPPEYEQMFIDYTAKRFINLNEAMLCSNDSYFISGLIELLDENIRLYMSGSYTEQQIEFRKNTIENLITTIRKLKPAFDSFDSLSRSERTWLEQLCERGLGSFTKQDEVNDIKTV